MINRIIEPDAIDAFIDRLTSRISIFPPAAVAAAKASVLRSEQGIEDELLAEGTAFSALLGNDETMAAMAAFMDRGGRTPEGERRLGELAAELGN